MTGLVVFVSLLTSVLGIVMNGWAHNGITDGDHERRAWGRYAGMSLAVLGALAAFVSAVVR